jgi:HlyD family secretion protein
MKPAYPELRTYTVHYDTLQVEISERGQVESAHNNDLICHIKAKTPSSPISTTIRWVIDEGSLVEKGQKLMELDASALEDRRKRRLIEVDEARSALVRERGDYDSALIVRRTRIANAKRAVELARIDLKMYSEGDYRQKLKEFENRMQETRTIVDMWEDRANWSERVAQRGYITPSQARNDDLRHRSAQHALDRQAEQRRVLDLEKEHTEMAKNGLIDEAKDNVDRAVIEADADVESKKITLDAAQKRYDLARSRLAGVEEQIGFCTITAPQSGMVVYYRDEDGRRGAGKPSRIRQGERVSEGQKLLRIPGMKNMQVITHVPESMVSNLRGDGQSASVRIDAFPDRELRGHVTRVSPVPLQEESPSADVKLYPVTIALDEPLEGLRLGMSARVTIDTDRGAERVLTVPLHAVVGSSRAGGIRQCYLVTQHGPEPRDIVVGISNGEAAEVKSGLQEGDAVVLNPLVPLDGKEKTENGGGQGRSAEGERHP